MMGMPHGRRGVRCVRCTATSVRSSVRVSGFIQSWRVKLVVTAAFREWCLLAPMVSPTTLAELSQGAQIGKGASAVVKLATCIATGERYCLKVVDKSKIVGQTQLARLYREKQMLGELAHPSIVGFHATLKDEGHLYFLLELIAGGELLWHMRREKRCRICARDARIVLGALLLPLRHMEELSVLYRDLKPTNILFTPSGRLKLIDFGHAKRIEGHAIAEERSMSVCGTAHYHAPEMVKGEGHGLPAQLWALGVLLVEMLYGRPPFWEAGPAGPLREQILAAEPDLIPLPEDAQVLASTLLTAEPAARHAACGGRGYAGVMDHAYFTDLDWEAIRRGELVPSFEFGAHAAELLGEREEPAEDVSALSRVFADF